MVVAVLHALQVFLGLMVAVLRINIGAVFGFVVIQDFVAFAVPAGFYTPFKYLVGRCWVADLGLRALAINTGHVVTGTHAPVRGALVSSRHPLLNGGKASFYLGQVGSDLVRDPFPERIKVS